MVVQGEAGAVIRGKKAQVLLVSDLCCHRNSSMYFPDWIYKDFERGEIMTIFGDQITKEEEKIAKKMVPPKPLLCLPAMVPETVEDSNETSSFSNPSQFERRPLSASEDTLRFPTKSFKNLMKEVESSSKPSSNKVSKASGSLT
ncbi:hypothetical protein F2Q69_00012051 [Brassica cretica]|uniref:Uncharacterized protein n=1 Tax=Brassica cretica TaxID=69181 RepID=A0A8S9R5Z3_BRACR|nr:hypothetical protein F2Q69_00012051 [Brassica cretica]